MKVKATSNGTPPLGGAAAFSGLLAAVVLNLIEKKEIENRQLTGRLIAAKREAYREVLTEWQKPYGMTNGETFISRLERMCGIWEP